MHRKEQAGFRIGLTVTFILGKMNAQSVFSGIWSTDCLDNVDLAATMYLSTHFGRNMITKRNCLFHFVEQVGLNLNSDMTLRVYERHETVPSPSMTNK